MRATGSDLGAARMLRTPDSHTLLLPIERIICARRPRTAAVPHGGSPWIPAELLMSVSSQEPTRRLLVITYHFPPDGAVGGLRWAGLSKYLVRLGWEVHVVTAAPAGSDSQVPGVQRHALARRKTLNDAYASFAQRRRPSRRHEPTGSSLAIPAQSASGLPGRLVANARNAVRIALGFPDAGRGWVLRAGIAARRLLRERTFDAVVTSGPPHSAHFAGVLATMGRSVPHVLDMRDPWTSGNLDFPAYGMDSHWLQPLIVPLQRWLFRRVPRVVVNTREFAEDLRRAEPSLRVWHVPNGTDVGALPPRGEERYDGISIAYLGTFYAGRRFSTIIAALAGLAKDRPHDAARIRLRIAGSMDAAQVERFREALTAHGIAEMVELHGRVTREAALDMLRRSHLALVLAQAQPTQVPAKLYECVGLGVPTLVLTERTSAAGREGLRIGAIVRAGDDVAGVRALFEDLLDGRVPATIPPAAPISYEALALTLDGVLRGLASVAPATAAGRSSPSADQYAPVSER